MMRGPRPAPPTRPARESGTRGQVGWIVHWRVEDRLETASGTAQVHRHGTSTWTEKCRRRRASAGGNDILEVLAEPTPRALNLC